MTQESAGFGVQGSSNQEKLKGLMSQDASAWTTPPTDGSRAALPWEDKPDMPPPSTEQPVFESPGNLARGSVIVNPDVQPAVYPGANLGELRYWNGTDWDPRPVAPVWTRVWCWVIDNILGSVVAFVASMLLAAPVVFAFGEDSGVATAAGLISTFFFAAGYISYFALSYRIWGRTPGMMLGRLDVVRIKTGTNAGWGPAYLRALVLVVSQLSGILAIIWLVVTSSNARRQGPHDSAAGTVVLRRLKPTSQNVG
jgi:uncharacterized RDD family membrane protein YckC